jgi:predicted O-methyltransferase YrrM
MDHKYWTFRLRSAIRWYQSASTRYDVHSPFLAEFVREVVEDRRPYHVFGLVEQIRAYWAKQAGNVEVLSLGAPSKVDGKSVRPIAKLVTQSAIPAYCGELLFRLALWIKADTIIELGTNAGISTLYLHFADRRAELHTIEGNPAIAALAKQSFSVARCTDRLNLHVGTFKSLLPAIVNRVEHIDLLFIDGDHRYSSTLSYFREALPKLHENAVVVIADIHWSKEMEKAWTELRDVPEVTASVDWYHFGILFFKSGLTPDQHLSLISTQWKPWRMGFFS